MVTVVSPQPLCPRAAPDALTPVQHPAPTVLLVEAHADTRALYEIWLVMHGFGVVACDSALDALTCVRSEGPDVIVIELMMPGGGPKLIAELRATPEGADALLIVLTTQSTAAVRAATLEAGADIYAVKPCVGHELGEMMAAVSRRRVAGHRARQRDLAIRERIALALEARAAR
jgi:DNA-binding response OmpR family regulator